MDKTYEEILAIAEVAMASRLDGNKDKGEPQYTWNELKNKFHQELAEIMLADRYCKKDLEDKVTDLMVYCAIALYLQPWEE